MRNYYAVLALTGLLAANYSAAAPASSTYASLDSSVTPALEEQEPTRSTHDADSSTEGSVCPIVTFSEIFADPDNIQLNYCYLRQKIEGGDVKAALPVVERILLLEPHQEQARVLYASLLYHNDMMSNAKRTFEDIDRVRLPSSNQTLVIDYLRRIDELDKRLNQSVEFTLAGHTDDNRNAAPEGDTILFYGFEFPYKIKKVDDYGTQGSVRYDIAYKFGDYRNHRVLGYLEYARDNQALYDNQDFASLNSSAGARFDLNGADLTTLGYYSFHRISGSSFLRSLGSQLSLSRSWHLRDSKLTYRAVASTGWFSDTYINSDASPSAEISSGDRLFGRVTGSVTFDTTQQLSLGINYATKNTDKANTPEYEYDSWSTSLSYLWLFGGGHSLTTSVSGGRMSYLGTAESISGDPKKVRLDTPVRASVTLTTPVAWFVNLVNHGFRDSRIKSTSNSPVLKNFTLALSGEYLSNHSNIPNYDYDNVRWQALFRKRFEF